MGIVLLIGISFIQNQKLLVAAEHASNGDTDERSKKR